MTIVLDLSMPPSVNAIWRSCRGRNGKPRFYLHPKYEAWKRECDGRVWTAGWPGGWAKAKQSLPIRIPVIVRVVLDAKRRRGDCDNRLKVVLDLLQRSRIIANDSLVEKVSAEWGEAPIGCRVAIEALR
jgi:Holliday junction resolvase RusA-like endonuclease